MAGHPVLASPRATLDDHGVSFREATRVWARVALLSFGGPAGQIAVMHRIIVDEKRWVGESRVLHALSYCTLLPGPEAQQLATYIGGLGPRRVRCRPILRPQVGRACRRASGCGARRQPSPEEPSADRDRRDRL